MKTKTHRRDRLDVLLREAYFSKENRHADIGDRWQSEVMRRIRQVEVGPRRTQLNGMFETLVWRLSPAVAVLIIFLALGLLQFDPVPDAEMFQLISYEFEDLQLMQALSL